MKNVLFAAAMLAVAIPAAQAEAQLPIPLSVEGRLDYAVPTGDLDDQLSAESGVGVGVGVSLGLRPGLGVYGTYSNTRFGAGLFDDEEPDAKDAGFSVGLTAALPVGGTLAPWIGAGAVFHTLELNGSEEGIDEDVGFEVGGGIAVPLTRNVRLTPGIGYRRYGVDIQRPLVDLEMDVSYFTAGVGLNVSF